MENIMKRHNGRIIAVLTLYNMDLSKLTDIETLNVLNDIIMMEAEEEYPVEIDNLYAHKIVDGVVNNLNAVDTIIIKSLVKYTIDRLSYVDRALIRVATYEMKFLGVDPKIAINEAVEITKEYSAVENDLQVKFNNKLLDNIAKVIYEQ
jgi:N utilization substance protein B